ncbi:hypothetical protein AAVH_21326 [Aphelenchoides avenae]|nr:hypothetical protein AAVH_21326 [Aphelenchus avenae]
MIPKPKYSTLLHRKWDGASYNCIIRLKPKPKDTDVEQWLFKALDEHRQWFVACLVWDGKCADEPYLRLDLYDDNSPEIRIDNSDIRQQSDPDMLKEIIERFVKEYWYFGARFSTRGCLNFTIKST